MNYCHEEACYLVGEHERHWDDTMKTLLPGWTFTPAEGDVNVDGEFWMDCRCRFQTGMSEWFNCDLCNDEMGAWRR